MSAKELESLINKNLDISNGYQEIESFFDGQGWIYDYDRHTGRYQARDPVEDQLSESVGRHQIYVYVDDQKNFVRAEVVKMHKAP